MGIRFRLQASDWFDFIGSTNGNHNYDWFDIVGSSNCSQKMIGSIKKAVKIASTVIGSISYGSSKLQSYDGWFDFIGSSNCNHMIGLIL